MTNRSQAIKAHDFNTGLELMAVIDKAIRTSPELLDVGARTLAAGYIADLLGDLFGNAIKTAMKADAEDSVAIQNGTASQAFINANANY